MEKLAKFFLLPEDLYGDHAIIKGSDAYHLSRVLRKKTGDKIIIVCQQTRQQFEGRIEAIHQNEIHLKIIELFPSTSPTNTHPLTLVQAIPKHAAMDLIIQKATELGVDEIIPLASRYSFVNSEGMVSEGRLKRWQKIGQEAAKQCGRNSLPVIHEPANCPGLFKFCQGFREDQESKILCLLLWEKERKNQFKDIIKQYINQDIDKIILLVGPEGGFSDEEIHLATQAGFLTLGCGPLILRTETAAIFALSVIQYEFNFS